MGLFSTVLHLYNKPQIDIVNELSKELNEAYGFSRFSRLSFDSSNYKDVLESAVETRKGIYYLVTEKHDNWTTIIELNVNVENPVYLYQLCKSLSKRLATFTLSFHLHDSDVLYYNLDKEGESLDGYTSDYQYFLTEPADRDEVLTQRHNPEHFSAILPEAKTVEGLNEILNEGYWAAFDNSDLDDEGVPNDDKYFVDEEERFVRIGKYLEIYSDDDYPFANWHVNLGTLKLADCYLLKVDR
jgi:hypothetical protein